MEGRVDNGWVARGAPVTGGVPHGRPGRTVLLALLLFVGAVLAVAVLAAPALADVDVSAGGDIPDFVLEEGGLVVIDGDQATDCPSFALALEEGYGLGPNNPERARAVLEQCEEAGLLDSGGGTPSASPSASASASGSASPSSEVSAVDGEGRELPETGGPALPALLVVAVGVVAASGLLARKVAG